MLRVTTRPDKVPVMTSRDILYRYALTTIRATSPQGTLAHEWGVPRGTAPDDGAMEDVYLLVKGIKRDHLFLTFLWEFGNAGHELEDIVTEDGVMVSAYQPRPAERNRIARSMGVTSADARKIVKYVKRKIAENWEDRLLRSMG